MSGVGFGILQFRSRWSISRAGQAVVRVGEDFADRLQPFGEERRDCCLKVIVMPTPFASPKPEAASPA